MSYGNQYMHDRNLPRFGYTDAAPLAEGHVLSETKPDGSLRYSLSEEYMDQQLAHRKKLGKWEPGEPDPRLFVCSLQPFVDSVQMTIDGVNAYRKVAQVEFNKWWEMDPNTGNDPETFYGWPVRKYNYLDGHLADATRNVAGYNIYFIRLPEIYLMYAYLLKDSDPAAALEYVNKVKRRAYGWISLRLSVTLPPVVACTHKSLVPSHVLADSIRTMLVLGMWHCTHSMALPLASCAWGESANSC